MSGTLFLLVSVIAFCRHRCAGEVDDPPPPQAEVRPDHPGGGPKLA